MSSSKTFCLYKNVAFIFNIAFLLVTAGSCYCALAVDYGVFDARALSMGGTSVALGNASQAAFYNPALLTFKLSDEKKEAEILAKQKNNKPKKIIETRKLPEHNGRFYVPTLVVQASDTVTSVLNALDNNLDTKLSNAINNFNKLQIANSAALVSTSAIDLREVLNKIANKDLTINGFFGLSGGDSSGYEGSALYMGIRFMGVGTSKVTEADLALLDEYIVTTNALAAGASPLVIAVQHPNLVNDNGTLKDPTKTLTSSADVSALAITEGGMSVAREMIIAGQTLSIGMTPKVMLVNAYRKEINFTNSGLAGFNNSINQFSDTKSTYVTFNADIGAAILLAEHYRVGIAVKDVFSKDFNIEQNADPMTKLVGPDKSISLNPRSRLGLGYVNKKFSVGFDVDLTKFKPMTNETATQDISFGAEYRPFKAIALRAGLRQDLTSLREDAISLGIGFQLDRALIDFAYSESRDVKAGGFQFGWIF
jgi:hypothetical protein